MMCVTLLLLSWPWELTSIMIAWLVFLTGDIQMSEAHAQAHTGGHEYNNTIARAHCGLTSWLD